VANRVSTTLVSAIHILQARTNRGGRSLAGGVDGGVVCESLVKKVILDAFFISSYIHQLN
jgi:hypothetical protein